MDTQSTPPEKLDVYQIVTNRIIGLLEQGTVPWQKPWTEAGIPMNLLSKRPYRGINLWLLLSLNYERNLFLTWDQLKKIGGSVKKDEHGHVVIYWKSNKKEESAEGENKSTAPLLRYYKVFNVAQCRDLLPGLIEPLVKVEHNPIAECEAVIGNMPNCPVIDHKEQSAYYDIVDDYINMPKRESFKTVERYYSTLFHELVHSTGAEKRLNRKSITEMAEFGDDLYSFEELIAELGASYLNSFSGISASLVQNSAAYIQGWLGKLKGDKRLIVQASGQAQRAVDFIINRQSSPSELNEETVLAEG